MQPESNVYVCCTTFGQLEIGQQPRKGWLALLASAMLSCPERQLLVFIYQNAAVKSGVQITIFHP